MKLVDILARELKEWPEGIVTAVQDLDGEVKFDNSHEAPVINSSKDVWVRQGTQGDSLYYPQELAEDCSYAIVTRAQWQAAADALKAAENAVPEWTGEGLPPVGTVCEMSISDPAEAEWFVGIVVVHIDLGRPVAVAHNGEEVFHGYAEDFRPIRTPEQIAAEERRVAVKEMCAEALSTPVVTCDQAEIIMQRIYDAGYRKFEIVDN